MQCVRCGLKVKEVSNRNRPNSGCKSRVFPAWGKTRRETLRNVLESKHIPSQKREKKRKKCEMSVMTSVPYD